MDETSAHCPKRRKRHRQCWALDLARIGLSQDAHAVPALLVCRCRPSRGGETRAVRRRPRIPADGACVINPPSFCRHPFWAPRRRGFLYTLPQPRIYQAHTTIEVQGLNEDFLGLHNVSPTVSPTSNYYPDFDIQTQVKIMQSESLAKGVVRRDLEKVSNPPRIMRPPDRLTVWKKALKMDPPTQDELWKSHWPSARPPPVPCACAPLAPTASSKSPAIRPSRK